MPFKNTRLIPRGLAEFFRPTVDGSFTATIDIRHPDATAGRSPDTGRTTFAPQAPFYAGGARVQGNPPGPDVEEGSGQDKATASYLVAVPYDVTEARIGDIIRVYSDDQDPGLAGLTLRMVGTWKATILLQRNLRCELYETAQKGTR